MNLIKYCFYLISSLSAAVTVIQPVAAEKVNQQFLATNFKSLYISRPTITPNWLSVGKFLSCQI
jgi:hypothetical protein